MEDANMSQSAEQTAIGSVPPDGQGGVKRQVSADAFRALTMRLNGKTPPASAPLPIPPVELVAAPKVVVETTVVPIPTIKPSIEQPLEQVMAPSLPKELAPERAIVPTPDPVDQSSLEPEALNVSDVPVSDPENKDVAEPNSDQVLDQLALAPIIAVEPVCEEASPEQQIIAKPEPEPLVEQPLTPNIAEVAPIEPPVQNIVSDVVSQVKEVVVPSQFAMPASGTRIILDSTPRPKSAIPDPLELPSLDDIPEAVQLGEVGDVSVEMLSTEPEREPIAISIDPLQAAMNLMNATVVPSEMDQLADPSFSVTKIENIPAPAQIPLSETAADAIAQDFEIPAVSAPTGRHVQEDLVPEVVPVEVEKPVQSRKPVEQRPVHAPPVIGDAKEHLPEVEPDAQSGETARDLLGIMSSGSQPQERALAADTLLQLIPRMMVKDLVALAERVCMMEDAPSLLVKALINHRDAKVASPLLEDGKVIVEQDLLRLITTTEVERLIMMAKHRNVTQTVCDALIARGEPSVYLTLVRNPGAALSHDAFVAFNEIAKSQSSLQAPLATRGDTPPPIAFELFWSLPVELRRYVLSRFLTDSATLDKILKITQAVDSGGSGELKFPPARRVEELVGLIADGVTDQAAELMAELSSTNQENARRIIADPDGEPLTVVLKTMGQTRAQFSQSIKRCASSSKAMLRSDRDLAELQIMFDSLSFNKARTLLTYWDWAIEKTGPYSRRVM